MTANRFEHISGCFKEYLSCLNSKQVNHLGIKETDKQKFLSTKIAYEFNTDKRFEYQFYPKSSKSIANFSVMHDDDYSGGNMGYAKILMHEFNHRMQDQRGVMWEEFSEFGAFMGNFIAWGSAAAGGVLYKHDRINRRNFVKFLGASAGGLVASHLITKYAPSLEDDADIFADKVLPEYPFAVKMLPRASSTTEQNIFQKALDFYGQNFIEMHKRANKRVEDSIVRCKENLIQQESLNMPSFKEMLGY